MSETSFSELAKLLQESRFGGELLCSALSFTSNRELESELEIGAVRSLAASCWEEHFGEAIPFVLLREFFAAPIPVRIAESLRSLNHVTNVDQIAETVRQILVDLKVQIGHCSRRQTCLFENSAEPTVSCDQSSSIFSGSTVVDLEQLVESDEKFGTIYADPPWRYKNTSSRGAAENHYPTMSVAEISKLPISQLVREQAHLHLWTTNAFLKDSFTVMNEWGFTFKSCFVWVKNELGMGNYWRVSHEFLLLGVRGNLTFRDRSLPSWIQAPRTLHSRKPRIVRELVEKASPGPYLELFGREELPCSEWTVFGNNVEKRLF